MTTMTRYFARPITTSHNLLDTFEQIAARFGIDSPTHTATVDDVLAAEPTPVDVIRAAAAASIDTTDAAELLDDTITRYTRAVAVEAIRSGLKGHRENITRSRAPRLLEAITPDLDKRAASTITAMGKAAAVLPAGVDALDAEAVIVADVAAERQTVIAALTDLAALSSVHESSRPDDAVPPTLHLVLPVVDLPTVAVERVNMLHRATLNPNNQREAVRRLARDLEDHGPDIALVNIARGDYDGVTLSWAATRAEVRARSNRAADAFKRVVDQNESASVAAR